MHEGLVWVGDGEKLLFNFYFTTIFIWTLIRRRSHRKFMYVRSACVVPEYTNSTAEFGSEEFGTRTRLSCRIAENRFAHFTLCAVGRVGMPILVAQCMVMIAYTDVDDDCRRFRCVIYRCRMCGTFIHGFAMAMRYYKIMHRFFVVVACVCVWVGCCRSSVCMQKGLGFAVSVLWKSAVKPQEFNKCAVPSHISVRRKTDKFQRCPFYLHFFAPQFK